MGTIALIIIFIIGAFLYLNKFTFSFSNLLGLNGESINTSAQVSAVSEVNTDSNTTNAEPADSNLVDVLRSAMTK